MIVCGDFNINTIEENLLTKNYKNVIASNGFDLSPELPTRIATNSATCIDHFIYQNINSPTVEIMEQENISDHFPIVLECQFNSTERNASSNFRDTSFLNKPELIDKYRKSLQCSLSRRAADIKSSSDITTAFAEFENVFEEVLELFAPKVDVTKNTMPRKPKWYDNKLKNLRTKRNKAHRNWKRDKNNQVKLTHFQELRKNFENSVTKAKKQFYWNKFKSCIGDSRQTYKLLNDISGKTKSKTNIPFLDNMAKCTDSENNLHIADAFNEHFVNIAESITKDIPKVAPPVVLLHVSI